MVRRPFCLLAVGLSSALAAAAQAADRDPITRYRVPNQDAAELAALAPPTSRATAKQTYGDAAIARSRFQRRTRRTAPTEREANAPLWILPCEMRIAPGRGYACGTNARRPDYGRFYVVMPAHVTAPQNAPNVGSSLLPPATSLFLSANNFLFGNIN